MEDLDNKIMAAKRQAESLRDQAVRQDTLAEQATERMQSAQRELDKLTLLEGCTPEQATKYVAELTEEANRLLLEAHEHLERSKA